MLDCLVRRIVQRRAEPHHEEVNVNARLGKRAFLLISSAALFACATGDTATKTSYGDIATTRIAVDPGGALIGSVRIWLVPESGARRFVGVSGGIAVDTIDASLVPGELNYRLVGTIPGGREIVSPAFTLSRSGLIVSWDLRTNIVFVKVPPAK